VSKKCVTTIHCSHMPHLCNRTVVTRTNILHARVRVGHPCAAGKNYVESSSARPSSPCNGVTRDHQLERADVGPTYRRGPTWYALEAEITDGDPHAKKSRARARCQAMAELGGAHGRPARAKRAAKVVGTGFQRGKSRSKVRRTLPRSLECLLWTSFRRTRALRPRTEPRRRRANGRAEDCPGAAGR